MLSNFKVAQIVSIISILVGLILVLKDIKKSKFDDRYNEYEGDIVF